MLVAKAKTKVATVGIFQALVQSLSSCFFWLAEHLEDWSFILTVCLSFCLTAFASFISHFVIVTYV